MNILKKKILSIISWGLLSCFILVFSFQVSFDFEEAARLNVKVIENTITALKTELLYPYLNIFIHAEIEEKNPVSENQRNKTPVKEKSGKGTPYIIYTLMAFLTVVVFKFCSSIRVKFIRIISGCGAIISSYYIHRLNIFQKKRARLLRVIMYNYDRTKSVSKGIITSVKPYINCAVFLN